MKTKTAAAPNGQAPVQEVSISLLRLKPTISRVAIRGLTPLIVNQWSAKAKQQMLDKHMGKAREKKPPKDPEKDFQASLYKFEGGGYGFPASAFKAAIVEGARFHDGVTMTQLRGAIRVEGEGPDGLVKLDAPKPRMRQDMVRNETGVADIRFRGEFWPWRCVLTIRHVGISKESVLALVDAAGFGGVGEWRPNSKKSNSGSYGTFEVEDTK